MSNAEKKLTLEFTSSSSSDSDIEEQEAPVLVVEDEKNEEEEEEEIENINNNNNNNNNNRKRHMFPRQLSMREAKWENRRMQVFNRRKIMTMMLESQGGEGNNEDNSNEGNNDVNEEEEEKEMMKKERGRKRSITDEDLDELRGSIELGFGFNVEDGGQDLCDTLPALNLYFAVNRQLSDPKLRTSPRPVSTPMAEDMFLCGSPTPGSPFEDWPDWKICNPGDNPQHVKTRLRHWAQVVACSIRQCC